MSTFYANGNRPSTDPFVKAARAAIERLNQCAAFHGHHNAIHANMRHDIEVMARHRDVKKISLNFVAAGNQVLVGPYVTTVTAGRYKLAVPMQPAARTSLRGAGQPFVSVATNGHMNGYRHLLRIQWPDGEVPGRRYYGVVSAIKPDRTGWITDRFGHTAFLPRGENHGFYTGQNVSYLIYRTRQGVIAGEVRPAAPGQMAA